MGISFLLSPQEKRLRYRGRFSCISSRLMRSIFMPSLTGMISTRSPLLTVRSILLISSQDSLMSTIFELILQDVSIGLHMIFHGWRKIWLRRVSARPVPNTFGVLVCPRSWTAAGVVFAGTQLNINLLPQGLFIPCFLQFAILQVRRTSSPLIRVSGTLGTCSRKFGYMPRNYILLRLYLLFALLIVFTSTLYSDAISLILILRLT